MVDTYILLGKLKVPNCARPLVASQVSSDTGGTPMMVGANGIHTKKFDLLPVMNMTFRRDDEDYIDRVYVDTTEPFVGRAYTYRCDGYYGAVGYMPKCQNLGVLEMRDPAIRNSGSNDPYIVGGVPGLTNFNDYWGGGSSARKIQDDPETPIPEPGVFILLLAGIVIMLLFMRFNRGAGNTRRNVLRRNCHRPWGLYPRRRKIRN
jgi:hypothetical protein